MATISLRFITNGGATNVDRQQDGCLTHRILAAEKINMGAADNQATLDA